MLLVGRVLGGVGGVWEISLGGGLGFELHEFDGWLFGFGDGR